MRVPVYEAQVRNAGIDPAPVRPGPNGLADLGQGIERAAGSGFGIAQAAKERETAAQITDLETGLYEDWTEVFHDDQAGLKSKRGTAAYADGADRKAMEEIARRRRERLAGIGDPRARAVAAERTARILAGFDREVEGYVGGERKAAEIATVQGRQAVTLDELSRGAWADPARRAELIAEAEGPLRALALSPEAGEAAVGEWRRRAHGTVLTQLLSEDPTEAAAYFAEVRPLLGPDASRYERVIRTAERQQTAFRAAQETIAGSIDPDGYLDEGKADRAFASRSFGSAEERKLAEGVFAEEKKRWAGIRKAEVGGLFRELFTAYNTDGWGSLQRGERGAKLARLNHLAPELYDRLRDEEDRRRRAARTAARDGAEARRDQALANLLVRQDFLARDPEERASLDIEETYGALVPEGAIVSADAAGIGALRVLQQQAKGQTERGEIVPEQQAKLWARAQFAGMRLNKQQVKQLDGKTTEALLDFKAREKRFPTASELPTVLDPVVKQTGFKRTTLLGIPLGERPVYGFEGRATGDEPPAPEETVAPSGETAPAPAAPPPVSAPTGAPRPAMLDRALQLRASGLSSAQIADQLNAEGY